MKRSKKYLEASSKIDRSKKYSKDEAVKLVKELSSAKFDETILNAYYYTRLKVK